MKKGLLILGLALLAGIATFCVTRMHRQAAPDGVLLDSMPELSWLRTGLQLTDDQFAKAGQLHAAYRPVCAEMCHNIAMAHEKLETLARSGRGMTPELDAAIREHARVHAECQRRMLEHLYQTAALFDDRQAARFLETMVPHALDSTAAGSESCHKH